MEIPCQLARIFESLRLEYDKEWPRQFLEAIPVGANLMIPYWQFMHWLLVDPEDGVIKFAKNKRTKKAIEEVAALYVRLLNKEKVTAEEWRAAYADADADAADAAAADAAAYDSADAAADAVDAAARLKARKRQAEKLIELLKSAPIAA